VLHKDMLYDPIQGENLGHGGPKCAKMANYFKGYLHRKADRCWPVSIHSVLSATVEHAFRISANKQQQDITHVLHIITSLLAIS